MTPSEPADRRGPPRRRAADPERERLLEAERAARRRTEQLQALTARLARADAPTEVVRAAVDEGGRAAGAGGGAVALLSDDGARFTLVAGPGITPAVEAAWLVFPNAGDGPAARAVRTGQPVWSRTRAEYVDGDPALRAPAEQLGIEAEATLPLRVGGRTLGTLSFVYSAPRAFDPDERAFLVTVAEQCAQALERARLLETERAARAQLESMLASISDAFFALDRDWRFTYANRQAERVLGARPDALTGQVLWDALPEVAGTTFEREYRRAMASGQPVEFEARYGPTKTWYDVRARPNAHGLAVYLQDVTARREAAERLRASEQRFRGTFDNAAVGIAHVSPDGRWLLVNRRLCEIVGRQAEALLALSFQDITHPADLRLDLDHVGRMLSGELDSYSMEKRYFRADGSIVWANLTVSLVRDDDGAPDYFISVVEDVSQRKAAEAALRGGRERLALALEAGGMGLWEWDPREGRSRWSAREFELLGYGEPTPDGIVAVSDAFFARVLADDRPRVEAAVARVVDEGAEFAEEFRIEHPTLGQRWLAGRGRLVRGADDGSALVIGLNWDVTERRAREDELARLNAELERRVEERTLALSEANAELQAFAHSVAHDLRAPLRNVEGFADALLEDELERLTPDGVAYLQRIVAGVARMDELIGDLLAYSRLSRADIRLERVELDLVVQTILRDLQQAIAQSGARVTVPSGLPAVLAHRATLTSVLGNLVSNAMKFVAPGAAPRVRIGAERGGDTVRVAVEDDGIGIAPEHQERIFGVFERLHGHEEYPGTGIGLAIVRRGVERMRGRLRVVSAPGAGSRFEIELRSAE